MHSDRLNRPREPFPIAIESLNFGEAWETDNFEHKIRLTNHSKYSQTIHFKPADCCGRVMIDDPRKALEPGESIVCPLHADLSSQCSAQNLLAAYDYLGRLAIHCYCETGESRIPVTVTGKVRRSVIPHLRAVNFGALALTSNIPKRIVEITLPNQGNRVTATCPDHRFRATIEEAEKPNGPLRLIIEPLRTSRPANATSRIQLTVTEGTVEYPPVWISAKVEFVSDIQPESREVAIGAVPWKDSFPVDISVSSYLAKPFKIVDVQSPSPFALSSALPSDAKAAHRLSLRCDCQRGHQEVPLEISVLPTDGPKETFSVLVKYYGMEQP